MQTFRIISTFTLMVFVASLHAQELSVGFRFGLGQYNMKELSRLQEMRRESAAFPLKTTDNYPITPNYRLEFAINNWGFINKIALFSAYYSTGARSTRSDYSGRIDMDAVNSSFQFGLNLQRNFWKISDFSTGAYLEGAWINSKFKTHDYLELYPPVDYKESVTYNSNSAGISVEPGLALQYRLNPFLLQFNLGYFIDLSGKYYLKDDKNKWLAVDYWEVRYQWDGFRTGIQVSYLFGRQKPKEVSF